MNQTTFVEDEIIEPLMTDEVALSALPPDDQLLSPPPSKMLIDSMKRVGLINPVTLIAPAGLFNDVPEPFAVADVAAGRRRIKAARALGWEKIRATIYPSNCTVGQIISLNENDTRSPNVQAEYDTLLAMVKLGYSDNALCAIMGVGKAELERRKKLLALPSTLLQGLIKGAIAPSVAKRITTLSPGKQTELVDIFTEKGKLTGDDVYAVTRAHHEEQMQLLPDNLFGLPEAAGTHTGHSDVVPGVPDAARPWQCDVADQLELVMWLVPVNATQEWLDLQARITHMINLTRDDMYHPEVWGALPPMAAVPSVVTGNSGTENEF